MDTTIQARIVIVGWERFQLIEHSNSVRLMLEHFSLAAPPLAKEGEQIHEVSMGMPALLIARRGGYRLFASCFKTFQHGEEGAEFQRLREAYQISFGSEGTCGREGEPVRQSQSREMTLERQSSG